MKEAWYLGWEDIIRELYEVHLMTASDIAKKFEVHVATLNSYIRDKGLERKYPLKDVTTFTKIRNGEVDINKPHLVKMRKSEDVVAMPLSQYLKLTSNSKQG